MLTSTPCRISTYSNRRSSEIPRPVQFFLLPSSRATMTYIHLKKSLVILILFSVMSPITSPSSLFFIDAYRVINTLNQPVLLLRRKKINPPLACPITYPLTPFFNLLTRPSFIFSRHPVSYLIVVMVPPFNSRHTFHQ